MLGVGEAWGSGVGARAKARGVACKNGNTIAEESTARMSRPGRGRTMVRSISSPADDDVEGSAGRKK